MSSTACASAQGMAEGDRPRGVQRLIYYNKPGWTFNRIALEGTAVCGEITRFADGWQLLSPAVRSSQLSARAEIVNSCEPSTQSRIEK